MAVGLRACIGVRGVDVRRDAEPPAAYIADARRCRDRDAPRSPAAAAVRGPAPGATRVLDAPTPRATGGRGSPRERHLGRAKGACRADDGQRPRPAASVATRARRSARSQATTAAPTRRARAGTGLAPAMPVRRLRQSHRRHARRPAPATTQTPEQRDGHRPPRTHRQCLRAGAPRPTHFPTRVSQPLLDACAENVPRLSHSAGSATAFTGRTRPPASRATLARIRGAILRDRQLLWGTARRLALLSSGCSRRWR
jgi:hypothetical protein